MSSVSQVYFRNCNYVMCPACFLAFHFAEWFVHTVEKKNTTERLVMKSSGPLIF